MFAYQPQSAGSEGIIVRAYSLARSLADLKGRIVAVNRGGAGEYLLVQALDKVHLPLDPARRAYLAPPGASTALDGGHVDAWATWDPFLSVALQRGTARLLLDGRMAGSENAIAFYVSQTFLLAHRPVVAAVFNVLRAENAWARAHKEQAGEIWPRELRLPADVAARLAKFDTNPIGPVGPAEATHIEHIADWYVANHIIPARPEIAPFLTDISQ